MGSVYFLHFQLLYISITVHVIDGTHIEMIWCIKEIDMKERNISTLTVQ